MTDIHAHILPGVDDGSQSMDDSAAMAELALESGVHGIIATPHCGLPDSEGIADAAAMRLAAAKLRAVLKMRKLPLRLYDGMEIFGMPDTAEKLQSGIYTTLADSHYPLIEFPFVNYGRQATRILQDVCALGLRPIVAHPERYQYTQDEPELLNLWADMGCLLQVNRGSILGRFGMQAQALSLGMLARGFVHFVASDAHSPDSRTTWMQDIQKLLCREYSQELAQTLLQENPACILSDRTIEADMPDWF